MGGLLAPYMSYAMGLLCFGHIRDIPQLDRSVYGGILYIFFKSIIQVRFALWYSFTGLGAGVDVALFQAALSIICRARTGGVFAIGTAIFIYDWALLSDLCDFPVFRSRCFRRNFSGAKNEHTWISDEFWTM